MEQQASINDSINVSSAAGGLMHDNNVYHMAYHNGMGDDHDGEYRRYDEDLSVNVGAGSDNIKLFIGQIPRDMDESALRPIFEEFGNILDLTIIRDKSSKIHRGCAFLTFEEKESAVNTIQALHDKIKLPNATNPIQIRAAESQAERENKVFVGMLPKMVTELDLHDIFSRYGQLKEIHIIRGPDGNSKGCAFVKFQERGAAMLAINELHDTVPEGATRPLVVKFADSKKSSGSGEEMSSVSPLSLMTSPGDFWAGGAAGQQYSYSPQHLVQMQYGVPPNYMYYPPGNGQHYYPHSPYGSPSSSYPQDISGKGRKHAGGGRGSGATAKLVAPAVTAANKPPEGPSGANLFIYHLPRDLTDADLATLFAAFGNVISAKVFVDKKTGESKGFGFVSYEAVDSAEAAIQAMNGFQIGSKRLKVQHKRSGYGGGFGGYMDDISMMHSSASGYGRGGMVYAVDREEGQHHHQSEAVADNLAESFAAAIRIRGGNTEA